VFYNGGLWEEHWFEQMFAQASMRSTDPPSSSMISTVSWMRLNTAWGHRGVNHQKPQPQRPPRLPPRQPQPPRNEPDWHPAVVKLCAPTTILFDWHATLVDTLDAMYHAVDDLLPELKQMGLLEQLVPAERCRSEEDLKLLEYVRDNHKLHPKIRHDRKISRTDIFEILFGDNDDAKQQCHQRFTYHYRNYYGTALPFEPRVGDVLAALKSIGLRLGVITNRDREFFVDELATVDNNSWAAHFETAVCGDDTVHRKPHTDQILKVAERLDIGLGPEVWYVGDSTTDVIAAKSAGITSVFFNGALWDQPWLNRIFPGTLARPHKPDVVVNDFSELWALVLACRRRKSLTLAALDAELARQAERGHAVDQAEVDGLGGAPLLTADLLRRQTEDLGGGGAMDIFAGAEGGEQALVAGQMRHDAQLDLRIVRGQHPAARLGHEGAADAPALVAADRDVLQVGIA
jgi:phosphoglycolate phosphatase